jgi:predicted Zn finger-like uncharacterized protein
MTDSFVTQCPHCRTRFRVSTSQLGAAHGAVRCGACLQVFNAHQHLLDQPAALPASPLPASTPPAEAKAAGNASLEHVRIHDDLDLDSLDLDSLNLDEELARLEQQEQQQKQPALAQAEPALVPAQQQNLIEPPAPSQPTSLAAPAGLVESETASEPEPVTAESLPESLAEQPAPEPAEDTESPAAAEVATEAATEATEEIELTITDAESRAASTFRSNPKLFELSEDPLQLQWQAPRKPWARWLGWGLLNLLAAGALLGQYALYHFDELARQDQYRPWFEAICLQLGCTLPSKVDVSLIKSSNLVVRSHPDFAGALVVDAIIYNRASFAQPFPLLELRFSDQNNQLLANRRFKPGEYLSGELAGEDEMPPQTPIHISLDILDPGQEAVNYSLTFQSPE